MKSRKRDSRVYLLDILDAIERIAEYTSKGKNAFMSSGLMQDGVIRQLSIIGEASARLSKSVRETHAGIPWKQIIGMRNIIVHEYFGIRLEKIWLTVEEDLPPLRRAVQGMLRAQADNDV